MVVVVVVVTVAVVVVLLYHNHHYILPLSPSPPQPLPPPLYIINDMIIIYIIIDHDILYIVYNILYMSYETLFFVRTKQKYLNKKRILQDPLLGQNTPFSSGFIRFWAIWGDPFGGKAAGRKRKKRTSGSSFGAEIIIFLRFYKVLRHSRRPFLREGAVFYWFYKDFCEFLCAERARDRWTARNPEFFLHTLLAKMNTQNEPRLL